MILTIPNFTLTMPCISLKTLVVTLVLTPIVFPLLAIVEHVIRGTFSAARSVPGPGGGNILFGHIGFIIRSPKGEWIEEMLTEYGHVLRYKAFFGVSRVIMTVYIY